MQNILSFNLAVSTFVFWLAARFYLLPLLPRLEARTVLLPILLLHAGRHLGLMFLAPGVSLEGMPPQFAYPAALGDLLAAVLAVAALPAVAAGSRLARPLAWIFNVAGTLDLIMAVTLATVFGAPAFMGAAYWIPAFWVPALLVTHYITFVVLLKHWTGDAGRLQAPSRIDR
jgi:hypothetical protein